MSLLKTFNSKICFFFMVLPIKVTGTFKIRKVINRVNHQLYYRRVYTVKNSNNDKSKEKLIY